MGPRQAGQRVPPFLLCSDTHVRQYSKWVHGMIIQSRGRSKQIRHCCAFSVCSSSFSNSRILSALFDSACFNFLSHSSCWFRRSCFCCVVKLLCILSSVAMTVLIASECSILYEFSCSARKRFSSLSSLTHSRKFKSRQRKELFCETFSAASFVILQEDNWPAIDKRNLIKLLAILSLPVFLFYLLSHFFSLEYQPLPPPASLHMANNSVSDVVSRSQNKQ